MIKLVVFDLDGTLAQLGECMKPENVLLLKKLEARGIRIAICSGKPAYYLCGFLRQLGLKHPLLAGENGAVVQEGITLPPKKYWIHPISDSAKEGIKFLKQEFDKILPDMWYQPNLAGLTPFPKYEEEFDQMWEIVEKHRDKLTDLDIYRHIDCYDFMPKGISKKEGVRQLGKLAGATMEEIVCVGDGVNDAPMFESAGFSIGIQFKEEEKVDLNVNNIHEALTYLVKETDKKYVLDTEENKEFLKAIREKLLVFGQKFPSPGGGSYYLGDDGTPWTERPRETWITSRMAHVYSIGQMLGYDKIEDILGNSTVSCGNNGLTTGDLADAALRGLMGELCDKENDGWYAGLTSENKVLPTKQCYAHAFVILAATSGALAGRKGAKELLEHALEVYDKFFWNEEEGLSCDTWNIEFSELSSYRGLNANMHTVESFLAAADTLNDEKYRIRAGRIIDRVIVWAKNNNWRIPEHFTSDWKEDLECNIEKPDDPFKPYGATPGHGIEWSRLITQWACSTYENEEDREAYIDVAQALFNRAISDAWNADGAPGICYTTGWDGKPIVHDRMHWTLAEAINTSACLFRVTGKQEYADRYFEFMKYLDEKVLDHENGSWFHQLDQNNDLLETVWPGKSDLYHAFQATLIPYAPVDTSIAVVTYRDGV